MSDEELRLATERALATAISERDAAREYAEQIHDNYAERIEQAQRDVELARATTDALRKEVRELARGLVNASAVALNLARE